MAKNSNFFVWIMLNIGLPMSPLIIKKAINFFGTDQIAKLSVLDGVELIYYNLFLCVIMINLLSGKKMLIENILKVVFIVICVVDIVILILFYLQLNNDNCFRYSIMMLILVPLLLGIYKYRNWSE